MTSELNPCPFCGGKIDPEGWISLYHKGPECEDCGAPAQRLMECDTRAVPDVPELVTVGHLWEYAEYHSDDSGYYGYVKIITEENPSTHVSPASKIRRHSELVTRDQAAAIIEAKDAEIERWREQYREAVRNAFKDSGAALSGKEQS